MCDDVLQRLGIADGELEGEDGAAAVAEEGALRLAEGLGDGYDVAALLGGVELRRFGYFARAGLPTVVCHDGEVRR